MDHAEIIKNIAIVCKCRAVRYKTIKNAILNGARTLAEVQMRTRANTGCGKRCTAKILEMIDEYSQ